MEAERTVRQKDLEDLKVMRERGFSEAALEDILTRANGDESPLETLARHFNVLYQPKVRSIRGLLARLNQAEVKKIHLMDQLSAARKKREV